MINKLSKIIWDTQYQNQLNKYIKSFSDEKYRQFQIKLLPNLSSAESFIGVRLPKLQLIAKKISMGNYHSFLETAHFNSFESIMLYGLVVGNINDTPDIVFPLINEFIPHINNWSICDSFCSKLKLFGNFNEQSFSFICHHLNSNSEFELRFAIVSLLFYFINDTYINKLFNIFDNINHDGYYVKMAVAWAVSICFKKFPINTEKYLLTAKLDDFTYNKALQKICESLCVNTEIKQKVKSMKRVT